MKNLFAVFFLGFALKASTAFGQSPLPIPDTLSGPNYVLNMHRDSVQFFNGNKSKTFAFNQYHYLGPTLVFYKGNNINITVNNLIGDTTTVHWHGIHLPAKWDGGPHSPILPGASWHPQFTVMDNAATYWYHPHTHMKTAEHAIKGAAGLIIVRDQTEAALNLPRKYGVDDIPLVVQCQQYNNQNQAMPRGMQDSTLLVNGARANNGFTVVANLPAQVVRFRILNASGERSFNFGLSGNKNFKIIAGDGGLLNTAINSTRIRLAPGERAEILVDLNGMSGQSLYLKSYASELPIGVQGGPTMPMPPGSPPMNSPLNGIDFNILKINVTAQSNNPVTVMPVNLTTNNVYVPTASTVTRTVRFTADSLMVMDGPFYFNDSSFNMMRIDYHIPLNSVEVWKLVNETMVAHPFHMHDVQFFLIDRNSSPPAPEEAGRKDVVLVPSGDSVMFITKFADYADTIPYMYHCHILMHEDDGMMGQFVVTDNTTSGLMQQRDKQKDFILYPNPAETHITLKGKAGADVTIYNQWGEKVYAAHAPDETIDLRNFASGIYVLECREGDDVYRNKFIKP